MSRLNKIYRNTNLVSENIQAQKTIGAPIVNTNELQVDIIREKSSDKGITFEGTLIVDTINEKTKEAGLTIDSPLYVSNISTFNQDVYFEGDVHGINAIQAIPDCDTCKEDRIYPNGAFGFTWDEAIDDEELTSITRKICMKCIWETAFSMKNKERWMENNGDPVSDLTKRLELLETMVTDLHKELNEIHNKN